MKANSDKIILTDCGPVSYLEIPVQPGATILRGTSDVGKSETIKAISRLAGGDEDVSCRSGAAKGSVEGFGVKLGLSKSVRRTGVLEALAVEDGFGLGTLIDGDNLKQPEAADRARIKSLLRISGVKADPAAFHKILPGGKDEFDKLVSRKAYETDDIVEMARRIKADLDTQARAMESQADTEEGKAEAYRNAGDGLDMNADVDASALQKQHVEAVQDLAKATSQRDAYVTAQAKATEARAQLAAATASGKTVAECKAEYDRLETEATEAQARVRECEQRLLVLKSEERAAVGKAIDSNQILEAAKRSEAATKGWQAAIDNAAGGHGPSEDYLEGLKEQVEFCQQAIEQAAVVREARIKLAKAKEHTEAAEGIREKARSLRDAGRETDSVLSALVASPYMKVYGGRLMTSVEGRGDVLFHERSDGTRTRIACMEKLHRIRSINSDQLALIPIGQRQWNDLAPAAKKELIAWAVDNNACLISAEVTDDPKLTVEAITE